MLTQGFRFDLFATLVYFDKPIKPEVVDELKDFLRKRVDIESDEATSNGIIVYPSPNPFEELIKVGYWCLLKVLNARDFKEFLGKSAAFDFYCEYAEFDFSRFQVSWLLNLYPHTLEEIATNEKVKMNIRAAIATVLSEKNISESDQKRLQDILVKYSC